MKKKPRYTTQRSGLHPWSLSLKIVCHGFSFHQLPVLQSISRSNATSGISLLSPLASIPATAQSRTGRVPYQNGGGDQQSEPFRAGEESYQAEEDQDGG